VVEQIGVRVIDQGAQIEVASLVGERALGSPGASRAVGWL
jgi:hypothetical protein